MTSLLSRLRRKIRPQATVMTCRRCEIVCKRFDDRAPTTEYYCPIRPGWGYHDYRLIGRPDEPCPDNNARTAYIKAKSRRLRSQL